LIICIELIVLTVVTFYENLRRRRIFARGFPIVGFSLYNSVDMNNEMMIWGELKVLMVK